MKQTAQYVVLSTVGTSIALVWLLTMSRPAALGWNPWAYSEWLINYDAGFIRRGFSGWLIARLSGDQDPLVTVNLMVFVSYVLLCGLMVRAWFRSRARSVAALALAIVIPGGLFQMALSDQYFFRKEILFHVALGFDCVLFSLWASAKNEVRKTRLAQFFFAMVLLEGVILPLVHESYLFISFPAVWLLARNLASATPGQRSYRWLAMGVLGVAGAMFVLCAVFKGTHDDALRIWNMLAPIDRLRISPASPQTMDGGIAAIGWSPEWNFHYVLPIFVTGQVWLWTFAAVAIAGVLMVITLLDCRRSEATGLTCDEALRRHMAQLWFLFLASVPIYLLGVDWGRWMSSLAISYLFILFTDGGSRALTPPALWRNLAGIAGKPARFRGHDVWSVVAATTARQRRAMLLLALIFCLTFRPPECCLGDMGFNPYYRIKPMLMHLVR